MSQLKCHLQDFPGCPVVKNPPTNAGKVLWPPHTKSWLIGKDSDAGRDWGQEEKGTTQDEMAGWHHWLDGCESEWTPGVCDGQGGLVCCDSWGLKESGTTERLNWTELIADSLCCRAETNRTLWRTYVLRSSQVAQWERIRLPMQETQEMQPHSNKN